MLYARMLGMPLVENIARSRCLCEVTEHHSIHKKNKNSSKRASAQSSILPLTS